MGRSHSHTGFDLVSIIIVGIVFVFNNWNFDNFWQLWTISTTNTIAFNFWTIEKTILETCDIWDTDYNSDNWELEFMTIFVTWQLIVTLDSIRNSCDVQKIITYESFKKHEKNLRSILEGWVRNQRSKAFLPFRNTPFMLESVWSVCQKQFNWIESPWDLVHWCSTWSSPCLLETLSSQCCNININMFIVFRFNITTLLWPILTCTCRPPVECRHCSVGLASGRLVWNSWTSTLACRSNKVKSAT